MSDLQYFHPSTVDEAVALIASSAAPVDSPTQRRIRSDADLADTFRRERRRPSWVWGVRDGDGPTLGVVAAFGTPDGLLLLDVFGLPDDPEVARALVAHATDEAVAAGEAEALIFAPTDTTLDTPSLSAVADPLRAAGWRLLVERRHYEFEPPPGLGDDVPTGLAFERLADPADPRLVACHRGVMEETLDAHDRALIERVGFERACAESLQYLVEDDQVTSIHLAHDRSAGPDGEVVGMVSGEVRRDGRGVVTFVGVPRTQRGHGYGGQLLAWQTRELLAAGATTLVADTDNTNVVMARAFAAVGWLQTETRIDLAR